MVEVGFSGQDYRDKTVKGWHTIRLNDVPSAEFLRVAKMVGAKLKHFPKESPDDCDTFWSFSFKIQDISISLVTNEPSEKYTPLLEKA